MNNAPNLTVVIPVYKEAQHIKLVIEEIDKQLILLQTSYELIIVDDGSPDNTWSVINELASKYPMLKGLRLSRNFGKEYALCAGLEAAKGEAVIVMDGDLQHPPYLIPQMVSIWRESKTEIVEAIKVYRGKESIINQWAASTFYSILNRMSGYNLKNASDYKLLDRKVVNVWLKMGERNLFFRGMTAWLGFHHVQIPFEVGQRIGGKSKWSFFSLVKLAITGITAFSSFPLHFVTFSGYLFLTFSILLGLQALFLKFAGKAVDGFTTVILIILILGSLLMISLGIIGIYIARIYEEVKNRPRYIIAEILENSNK